jgi:hypothetical protein
MALFKLAIAFALLYLIAGNGELTGQQNRAPFTEGIIYSKATFPLHPIQPVLRRIDFNGDNISSQYIRLKDSLKLDPAGFEDPMFMSVIFLSPVSMKSTFEKNNSLIESQSLSYQLVNRIVSDSGQFMIRPFNNNSEKIEVVYQPASIKKIWEKYEINESEFTIQDIPGTDVIAGYVCKKMSFNFNGTSSQVLPSRLIGNIPWKVTVWYSELFPPSINVQQPFYFNLPHGVLKTQAEFDKAGKNKIIYEVTRVVPKDVSNDYFKITPFVLPLKYPAQTEKITTGLMSIMANALQDM